MGEHSSGNRLRTWWDARTSGEQIAIGVGVILVVGFLAQVVLTNPPPAPSDDRAASSRCRSAPPSIRQAIEDGLTVQGGGRIAATQYVRSDDFERVYFVAAEIDGPGLEGPGDVGVWATNSVDADAGLILAVDAVAQEFSVYPDADTTEAQITMADDGAREAEDCLG